MNFQDIERSKLRAVIADIQHHVPVLSTLCAAAGQSATADRFLGSWAALVELLALGPEPEVRKCPFCNGTIRQDATRCTHCWRQSSYEAEGPLVETR